MSRIAGWQAALADVMQDAFGRSFRWGRNDCCQFVARAAAAITGVDGRHFFPQYHTRAGAEEILTACEGMRGLLTKAFGEPVHWSRAGHGDIVLVDMGKGEQPAVCMGVNSYAPGRRGLEFRPTRTASAAWTI